MNHLIRILPLALLLLFAFSAKAEVFMVTSNQDSGPGTLREALQKAADNGTNEPDEIRFDIPGSSEAERTITLVTKLPQLSSNLTIDASYQQGGFFSGTDAKILLTTNGTMEGLHLLSHRDLCVFDGRDIHHFSIFGIAIKGFENIENVNGPWKITGLEGIFLDRATDITIGAPGKGNAFLDLWVASINIWPIEWPNGPGTAIFGNARITLQSNIAYELVAVYAESDVTIGGATPSQGNHFLGQHVSLTGDGILFSNNKLGIDKLGENPIERLTTLNVSYANGVSIHDNEAYFSRIQVDIGTSNFSVLRNGILDMLQITEVYGGIVGTDDVADANIFRPGIKWEQVHTAKRSIVMYDSPVQLGKNSMYCTLPAVVVGDNVPEREITILVNDNGAYGGTATPNADIYIYEDPTDCVHCSPVRFFQKVKADAQGRWQITGDFRGKRFVANAILDGFTSLFSQIGLDFPDNGPYTVTAASCGQANGSIRFQSGKKHVLAIEWFDQEGNLLGSGFEIKNLLPGYYYAHAKSGNCYFRTDLWIPNNEIEIYDTPINVVQPGCDGSLGSISGVEYFAPMANDIIEEWMDANGRVVATGRSLYDVGPGSYTLRLSGIAGCPVTLGPFTLQNTSGPTLDERNAVITHTACDRFTGSIRGITATGQGTLTYTWRNEFGYVVGNTPDLIDAGASTYTLEVSDQGSCNPLVSATYTIQQQYHLDVTVDDSRVAIQHAGCDGSRGAIRGIEVTGADRYVWIDASHRIVSEELEATGLLPGSYSLQPVKGLCAEVYGPYIVEERIATVFPTYNHQIEASYCGQPNGSIRIDLGNGLQPATLRWLDANGRVVGTEAQLNGLEPSTYTLMLTDAAGCEVAYNTYTVERTPPLTLNTTAFTSASDACGHGTGSITGLLATGGRPPYRYSWTNESGAAISQTADATALTTGRYRLTITDANGCQVTSATYPILNTDGALTPPSAPEQLTLCSPGNVSIPYSGDANHRYRLYATSQGGVALFEHTGIAPFEVHPHQTTTYYLSAADGSCESPRVPVRIEISNAGIRPPNAFSPNGDGRYDTWQVAGLDGYPNARVSIFNRNGQLVFTQRSGQPDFDGLYKGNDLPVGAYFYLIDLGMGCDPLKGSLNLLR